MLEPVTVLQSSQASSGTVTSTSPFSTAAVHVSWVPELLSDTLILGLYSKDGCACSLVARACRWGILLHLKVGGRWLATLADITARPDDAIPTL